MTTPTSYFIALGDDRYQPTELSGGTWYDDDLHLAPVGGLMVHHLERWREANTDGSLVYSRFAIEALGKITREPIELHTEIVRAGRTIELVEAVATINGRATLRARAWLLAASDTSAVAGDDFDRMPSRTEMTKPSMLTQWPGGFVGSLTAFASDETRMGRGQTWVTSEIPLVDTEPSTPLTHFSRLLDTANGVAPRANPREWAFPNVDLSLHFFREPTGEWLGLDGRVGMGPGGIGLTSSVMHDELGPVGTIQQSLTVRRIDGQLKGVGGGG